MPDLSPVKRRLFAGLTVLAPFLLVGLAEIGLRVVQYGPDLSLFVPVEFHGKTYAVMNPALGARYFTGDSFTPSPSTEYFTIPKPAGTYRIFCLGGSTVVGFPYWHNGSFAAFLRERLQRLFPEKNVEVINLGMTAVNSYTVLDLARELPAAGADLLVVYDGHNEFYGALGVASHQTFGSSRFLTLLYLRLIHFRLFLAMRDGYAKVLSLFQGSSAPGDRGPTLEFLAQGQYIPYGSATYKRAREAFQANLEAIAGITRGHGIPLLLGTQVSNLRDRPPFQPGTTPGLTRAEDSVLSSCQTVGTDADLHGRPADALLAWRAAAAVDSLNAAIRFHYARLLDTLGKRSEARIEYGRARDYDELRFRASADFNAVILGQDDGRTVGVVDMERLFMSHSPDSLIGNNLILDHLHPASYGQFLLAKGYAALMRERGILASPEEWRRRDTVPDDVLWDGRPLTDFDERVAGRRIQLQMSAWPFSVGTPVPPVPLDDTLGVVADHVADGRWGWGDGHLAIIEFYQEKGDWPHLEREYRTMIGLVPYDVGPRLELAALQTSRRQYLQALSTLRDANVVEPTASGYGTMGGIYLARGEIGQAIDAYEKARRCFLSPDQDVQIANALSIAYLRQNMVSKAEPLLRHVLTLRPGDEQAKNLLNTIEEARKLHRGSAGGQGADTGGGPAALRAPEDTSRR